MCVHSLLVSVVAALVLTASHAPPATAQSSKKACVKTCKQDKSASTKGFKSLFTAAKQACKTAEDKKQCTSAAKNESKANKQRTKTAFTACKNCCGGGGTDCSAAVCGDSATKAGAERCDDGNLTDGDGCDSNCTPTGLGNGIVTPGEDCDDGNLADGDGCDSNGTPTGCGNGIVTAGEQCDDGNATAGDGCDSDCTPTPGGCGDNVVTAPEECDDGNATDGDGCDSNCTDTGCGNGIETAGEDCDDGNATDGDGCDSNCTITDCGNGIVTAGEQCDDGDATNGDGCDSNCTPTGCGNGIVTAGEDCEETADCAATELCDACACIPRPPCGDGIVGVGEECDGAAPGMCPAGAGCFAPGTDNECECAPAMCDAIDANSGGSAASGTFTATNAGAPQAGALYCGGLAGNPAMAFQPCVNDASCGAGTAAGTCAAIPWLGVASFAPFPIASVNVTFTAGPPDAKCIHQATIPCGPLVAPCPATPALGTGAPCCSTPGFLVGTFFIPALGFCSHVDQTACGGGIVDTSVPMLGDNDVTKAADTTTPTGPGCTYVAGNVHPACAATEDTLGQITTTVGDGAFDAAGGHTRFTIPQRSVTWLETSAPPCVPASTFSAGELPITNFNLQLAPTTATAEVAYMDSADDSDAIAFCGAGPAAFGSTAAGAGDLPGLGSRTVAVGAALSGGGPLYDLLFSAVTPLSSPVKVADIPLCTPAPSGCPE